jgi:hypothetical protein
MSSAMAGAGYQISEQVFTADECQRLIGAICGDAGPARGRAGARHLMSHPAVAELAHHRRLLDIASRGLGGSAVPFRATLFEKSGRSNWLVVWHQDTALPLAERFESSEWGPWSAKAGILYAHAPGWALARVLALRVHLDDSSAANGPLRVLPGSHELGVLSDEEVFRLAKNRPRAECHVRRGGVLAMRPLLVHSSSKSQTVDPRRVLHIEYADSLDLAAGVRLAVA